MKRYFVSIGSNVNPYYNVALIIQELLSNFSQITISSILETEPIDMESDYLFLNLCTCLQTDEDQQALQKSLHNIETRLGRNRNHHNRKKKDRPADLDVLFGLDCKQNRISEDLIPQQPFIKPTLLQLLTFLKVNCELAVPILEDRIAIVINDITVGLQPATLAKNSNGVLEKIA